MSSFTDLRREGARNWYWGFHGLISALVGAGLGVTLQVPVMLFAAGVQAVFDLYLLEWYLDRMPYIAAGFGVVGMQISLGHYVHNERKRIYELGFAAGQSPLEGQESTVDDERPPWADVVW